MGTVWQWLLRQWPSSHSLHSTYNPTDVMTLEGLLHLSQLPNIKVSWSLNWVETLRIQGWQILFPGYCLKEHIMKLSVYWCLRACLASLINSSLQTTMGHIKICSSSERHLLFPVYGCKSYLSGTSQSCQTGMSFPGSQLAPEMTGHFTKLRQDRTQHLISCVHLYNHLLAE